jgi:hypothetical protein
MRTIRPTLLHHIVRLCLLTGSFHWLMAERQARQIAFHLHIIYLLPHLSLISKSCCLSKTMIKQTKTHESSESKLKTTIHLGILIYCFFSGKCSSFPNLHAKTNSNKMKNFILGLYTYLRRFLLNFPRSTGKTNGSKSMWHKNKRLGNWFREFLLYKCLYTRCSGKVCSAVT